MLHAAVHNAMLPTACAPEDPCHIEFVAGGSPIGADASIDDHGHPLGGHGLPLVTPDIPLAAAGFPLL